MGPSWDHGTANLRMAIDAFMWAAAWLRAR
jgi:hypothetical protein